MKEFTIGWASVSMIRTGSVVIKKKREYVWQEGQWCPGDLTRSQKRRVRRLRNRELEAQKSNGPQAWRIKQTADKGKPTADINMVFARTGELKAPSEYEQRKHKCLCSKIVKRGIIEVNDERQQLIQAVGSEDVS